jgi:renal tumor antigen
MTRSRVDALPDYKFIRTIGEGTFSIVYKVQHIRSGKYFALKQLRHHYTTTEEVNSDDEVLLLTRVGIHPHIVTLHDLIFDSKEHTLSLVLDLNDCNLLDLIRGLPLPIETCLSLIRQLLSALQCLHSLLCCSFKIWEKPFYDDLAIYTHSSLSLASFCVNRTLIIK